MSVGVMMAILTNEHYWRLTGIVLRIAASVFEIAPNVHPSPIDQFSPRLEKDSPLIAERDLSWEWKDMMGLKKELLSKRAIQHDDTPQQKSFNFSKLGCRKFNPLCPCTNRNTQMKFAEPGTQAISGGQEVKPFSLPWMFMIRTSTQKFCMGFLINYHFGLTAGHCLFGAEWINITMGVFDMTKPEKEGAFTLSLTPKNFVVNPHYIVKNGYYNVGLIQIANGISEIFAMANPHIAPACLAIQTVGHDMGCFAASWSMEETQTGLRPLTLQWLQLRFDRYHYGTLSAYNLDENGPPGLCQIDSGSPIMCVDRFDVAKVYGLLQWAPDECSSTSSEIKTLVFANTATEYKTSLWIRQEMSRRLEKTPAFLVNDFPGERFEWL